MLVDNALLFSDAQAITNATASTSYVDLTAAIDLGAGQPLYVVVVVDTALADTGSNSTLTVALYGDSTTTFTPDGSQTLVTIPATTAAGTKYVVPIAPELTKYRYLELYYTPNNGDLSAGAVTAFITMNPSVLASYPKGYTIN
jgi:hypothetical protein